MLLALALFLADRTCRGEMEEQLVVMANELEQMRPELESRMANLVLTDFSRRLRIGSPWREQLDADVDLLGRLGYSHLGSMFEKVGEGDTWVEYACVADFLEDTVEQPLPALEKALPGVRVIDLKIILHVSRRMFQVEHRIEVRRGGARLDEVAGELLLESLEVGETRDLAVDAS
ncbi:MAG: hypothetical protein ACI8QC_000006 [Planctomycetota bacterium]|jgi:hypothetical protein